MNEAGLLAGQPGLAERCSRSFHSETPRFTPKSHVRGDCSHCHPDFLSSGSQVVVRSGLGDSNSASRCPQTAVLVGGLKLSQLEECDLLTSLTAESGWKQKQNKPLQAGWEPLKLEL